MPFNRNIHRRHFIFAALAIAPLIGKFTMIPQNWQWHSLGRIQRQFEFPDFTATLAFMSKVAIAAAKQNHYPSWLNIHNRLTIQLGTSHQDFQLAQIINDLDPTKVSP